MPDLPGRTARSSSAAASSTRRNYCNCPVSARASCCSEYRHRGGARHARRRRRSAGPFLCPRWRFAAPSRSPSTTSPTACCEKTARGHAILHVPTGPAGQQRHLRRRLRAQRSAARASRHPAQFQPWSFAGRTRAGVYPHPFPGFTVSAVHLRPDARGDVRLKSADPLAAAGDPLQFPEDAVRPRGAHRRDAARAQDRRSARACTAMSPRN